MSTTTQAFTALFEDHWSDVHRYARRRTASDADAHDIAAETFTVAWRRFGEIPTPHALPWLYRTAANVLANQRRSGRRQSRLTARLAAEPGGAPASIADAVIEDDALRHAFAALSSEQRELLRLVAWEGLGPGDIAAVLGTTANAVSVRLSRARARFEAELETAEAGAGHEPDDRNGSTS